MTSFLIGSLKPVGHQTVGAQTVLSRRPDCRHPVSGPPDCWPLNVALDAKLHPAKEIGFLVRFIPVRLPAQYALTALLVWSVFGMMATKAGRGDGVAHATHFGGLVFGIAVYELMKRGIWSNWRKKWIRVWLMIAPRHGSNKRKIGNRR